MSHEGTKSRTANHRVSSSVSSCLRVSVSPCLRVSVASLGCTNTQPVISLDPISLAAHAWNVSDAQKLAQSALVPAGPGIMCTALISHITPGRTRNRTRPSASVRTDCFSAGF
jgi:hypothetical protein